MYQVDTWISNSSIGDFLKCPRSYFLKNVYKNSNGKKIALINPYLTLGQAVHEVLESLVILRCEDRFSSSLVDTFKVLWSKYSGELGGFTSIQQENDFKERGIAMIKRITNHPGPLLNKALKLSSPDELPPRYYISKEDNILLCGKIDWLEYFPQDDSVHIIDFKTGKNDESKDSLQLSIYCLLVNNLQKRKVSKISFWYIDREDEPREMLMPDLVKAHDEVLELGIRIKEARLRKFYTCAKNGCFACTPLEEILAGRCKFICTKGYQDIYLLD